jgi:hypothetical protein
VVRPAAGHRGRPRFDGVEKGHEPCNPPHAVRYIGVMWLAVLDLVALAVGRAVKARVRPLVLLGRDDRPNPAAAQFPPRGATAVAFVAPHRGRPQAGPPPPGATDRARVQQRRQGDLFMALPAGQDEADGLAAALRADMELRAEPAATTAERLGAPFLRAPAACWCARTTLPSTKCSVQSSWPRASAAACTAPNTCCQIPAACQRRKRLYTVCHFPYRSGRSRHGTPVRSRHSSPLTRRRWSWLGFPTRGFCAGSKGASRSHCWSVSSCLRIPSLYLTFANTP